MTGKEFKTPEFLQIKGYKYRAKMLIAGAVILIILIVILSLIIHGISSAVRGLAARGKDESDTDAAASVVSVVSSTPVVSQPVQSAADASSAPAYSISSLCRWTAE